MRTYSFPIGAKWMKDNSKANMSVSILLLGILFLLSCVNHASAWDEDYWSDECRLILPDFINQTVDKENCTNITQSNRIPIILVHGDNSENKYYARWDNKDNYGYSFLKYVRNYKDTHFSNFDVYIWYHNTSKPIGFNGHSGNAQELANFVKNTILPKYSEGTKVILVAHSRGGLVSRSFMNYKDPGDTDYRGDKYVHGLITLGTPHHGSPAAVPDWAAQMWKDHIHPVISGYELYTDALFPWWAVDLLLLYKIPEYRLTAPWSIQAFDYLYGPTGTGMVFETDRQGSLNLAWDNKDGAIGPTPQDFQFGVGISVNGNLTLSECDVNKEKSECANSIDSTIFYTENLKNDYGTLYELNQRERFAGTKIVTFAAFDDELWSIPAYFDLLLEAVSGGIILNDHEKLSISTFLLAQTSISQNTNYFANDGMVPLQSALYLDIAGGIPFAIMGSDNKYVFPHIENIDARKQTKNIYILSGQNDGIRDHLDLLENGANNSSYWDNVKNEIIDFKPTALTVTQPNGGEQYQIDDQIVIMWDSQGSPGDYVKIEIVRDGQASTIVDSTPNPGIYWWRVEGPISLNCKIRITSVTRPQVFSESSASFSILPFCSGNDLKVDFISASSSSIKPTQQTTISANVSNKKSSAESNINVTLAVTGPDSYSCTQAQSISSLGANALTVVNFTWPSGSGSCSSAGTDGVYTATISALSSSGCDELISDNQGSTSIYVSDTGNPPAHKAYKIKLYQLLNYGNSVTVGGKTFTYVVEATGSYKLNIGGSEAWYNDNQSYGIDGNNLIFWLKSRINSSPAGLLLVIGTASDSDGFSNYVNTVSQGGTVTFNASRSYDESKIYKVTGTETSGSLMLWPSLAPSGNYSTSGHNVIVDTSSLSTNTYRFAILTDTPATTRDDYVAFGRFDVTPATYTLSLLKSGTGNGQVQVNGVLRDLPYSASFTSGASPSLQAIPSGSRFTGWTGDLNSSTNPTSITMSSSKSITASFTSTYTLSLAKTGNGSGQVKVNSTQRSLPYSETFDVGSTVSLEAVEDNGSQFTAWSGDQIGTNKTTSITMNGNRSINLNFAICRTLTAHINPGTGGSIVADGTTLTDGQTKVYLDGQTATLTSVTSANYAFVNWGGDASAAGTNVQASLVMSANKSATANFTDTPVISVTPASMDFGSVQVGSTKDMLFFVQNTGGGTLSGSASVAAPFSVVSGSPYSVGSGQSRTVTVRYTPTTTQIHTQSIVFTGGSGATGQVTGNAAVPPQFLSASTTSAGNIVTVVFDKTMAAPEYVESFNLTIDGSPRTIIGGGLNTTPTKIDLILGSAIGKGQTILLSYGYSNIISAEGKLLGTFSNKTVVNNVASSAKGVPIFNPHPGNNTSSDIFANRIVKYGSEYRMFFFPVDDYFNRLATSSDGIQWNEANFGSIISSEQTGRFYNFYLTELKEGNTYKVWSSASSDLEISLGSLYYSTSQDGMTYIGHGMVLDKGGPTSFDSRGIADPWILNAEGKYHLYYSATCDQSSWDAFTIAYATSTDGEYWTKHGVVLNVGSAGTFDSWSVSSPVVFYSGGKYEMFYSGSDGYTTTIGYAVSSDGISWTKIGAVTSLGAYKIIGAVKEDGVYRIWYTTDQYAPRLFYATMAKADFNSDGKTDILMQNIIGGQLALWFMDGTNYVSDTVLPRITNYAGGWRIVGTGDFNKDDSTDILMQNINTGQLAVWFMDGSTYISDAVLSKITNYAGGWRIVGTADFNGDNRPDILMQNVNSGQLAIWFMDGTTFVSDTVLPQVTNYAGGWRIAGTGDFNKDGSPDILMQNINTGQLAIWFMDGSTYISDTVLSQVTNYAGGWRIVGTGDFNKDGNTDILMQNINSGHLAAWFMDGSTFVSDAVLSEVSNYAGGWRIVGPR